MKESSEASWQAWAASCDRFSRCLLTKAPPTSAPTVRDEFDGLFDQFRTSGLFGPATQAFQTMWSPSLDFSEDEKEYIVRLEAAGIPKEDLEVNVEGQTLTITGHREAGRFVRTVQLPATVDRAKVTAVYQDGIMTVRLPRAEPAAKSRIPIK